MALAGAHGVADAKDTRIEQAHDIARVRLVHDGAVIGHHRRARGKLELAVALHVEGIHAALELARANAHKSDAVAVVLVHVGLDLKDKAAKVVAAGIDRLAGERIGIGARRRGQTQELLEEGLHAKVGERRAKERRAQLAAGHGIQVELVAGAIEQLDVVHQVLMVLFANKLVHGRIAQLGLNLGDLLGGIGVAVALKGDNATGLAVEHAAEVAAATDRPVHGIRIDSQDVLDLFHELKRIASLVVELVHKGEDGNVAQRTDLKELFGLGLDALGAVDDHDCGVGGHKGTVGILREVLVAGGIEDVDAGAVVGELQHRGGNGNAALLLDVHPVRDGMLGRALALDRAGGLDAAGIEQQLLGKRGLTGVRVADDRECAARRDFIRQACHADPFLH